MSYTLKNQINDEEKLGGKISEEDKKTIEEAADEVIEWLDENPAAEKDDYDEKKKELESVSNPIMTKLYQQYGQGGAAPDGEDDDFEDDDDIPDHDEL